MKTRADLMQTSRGFREARTLLTAVELGVFEALGRRRLTSNKVAARVHTEPRATRMLLDALVGMGILVKGATSYAIRREMVPYLTEGRTSALDMLRHHARLWTAWSHLTESVRTGLPMEKEDGGARRNAERARAFTLAMRDGARRLAPGVAAEVPFQGCRLLLDLGGGPGIYAAAFARRNPGLEVVVVDLPDVCRVGEEVVSREERDVAERVTYHAADLLADPLPDLDADAAFLSHVIHILAEEPIQALFDKVRRALAPRGLLVVREFFTTPDRTKPPDASLFGLNMLVNTSGGRAYSTQETQQWLRKAGFRTATFRRSKEVPDTGYVLARK